MQGAGNARKQQSRKKWLVIFAAVLLMILARRLIWQTVFLLFSGMMVALIALPLMHFLEKKMAPGLAASLSLIGLAVGVMLLTLLLIPPLIRQGRQLFVLLPALWDRLSGMVRQGEGWLRRAGLMVNENLWQQLLSGGEVLLGKTASAAFHWVRETAGGVSRWMLAPVLGFYFLKDRRKIGEWLLYLIPAAKRSMCVRVLREIRRETAGYLRGQLMLSVAVGGLTAAGLLLCGIPAWLLLGALMGVLELIPYIGPWIGGAAVLLFGLQAGTGRMLWSLAVVLVVQQLESSWLSPRMMSDATRLHPVVVLLCVAAGGTLNGVAGILLAVPVVLCLRAVIRVCVLSRAGDLTLVSAFVKER
ncbi:MAG: AI-2E family transporter [Clostridiales bacterium]|nr:AI-2E family transporter [Clostridiales bacterium]